MLVRAAIKASYRLSFEQLVKMYFAGLLCLRNSFVLDSVEFHTESPVTWVQNVHD